jgi:hypothetical protein
MSLSIREKLVGIYANFLGKKYDWHKRRGNALSAQFVALNAEVIELNYKLQCGRQNNENVAPILRKLAANYSKSAPILKRLAREVDAGMKMEEKWK